MTGTQPGHDGLYEALVKLGLTTLDRESLPEPTPVDALPAFCAERGLRYFGHGEDIKIAKDAPVVAIYHYGGNEDSATYQLMCEVDLDRLSGLIVDEVQS